MLIFFVTSALASAQPATFAPDGVNLHSDRRDQSAFRAEIESVLPPLGECAAHTNGLDYGALTLSFMVGRRGEVDNISVNSGYVLPGELVKCLKAPLEDLRLGRGDVSVAKLIVTLPTAAPSTPEPAKVPTTGSGGGLQPRSP